MQAIGAQVAWAGEHALRVMGVEQGYGTGEIEMIPDRNDAATCIIAAVLGSGPVTVSPVRTEHLLPLLDILKRCGVHYDVRSQGTNQSVTIWRNELHGSDVHITSRPYPGFSTDWGPMMQVLLTQLPGTSIFHETIFSQRFAHVQELLKMGAMIQPFDAPSDGIVYNFDPLPESFHAVQIQGPSRLYGTMVHANDVRAGAALVLAGLVASGITEISGVEQIERGYEHLVKRLSQIGASIEQVQTSDE